MKEVNPVVKTAIRTSDEIFAVPRLISEWNFNMLCTTSVYNILSEYSDGYDIDMFPIESIVQPWRPKRGRLKARIGEGRVAKGYMSNPNATRFHTASIDDVYKYWTSPVPCSDTITDEDYYFPVDASGETVVQPTVEYQGPISAMANKIVIGIDQGWGMPTKYEIQIMTDKDAGYFTIADDTDTDVEGNGRIILYRQENGLWGGNEERDYPVNILGIRLSALAMDRASVFLNLIEISARYEVDLSSYLVSTDTILDMSDSNFITPLGKASANVATIKLFNDLVDPARPEAGLLFNNDNASSPFYQMIDSRAKMTLFYDYTLKGSAGNEHIYSIQDFEMYTDLWTGQTSDSLSISLKDFSMMFQEVNCPKVLFTDQRVPEIVYMLCDIMGFSDYVIETLVATTPAAIPYFWTDGTQTVWDVFSALAEGTQTAIYIDSFGQLNVKTRDKAYDVERPVDWVFRGVDKDDELADITQDGYTQTEQYEGNYVNVQYQTTEISDFNNGIPQMQQVWEPTDSVVLRTADLQKDFLTTDDFIVIRPNDAKIWPFSGIVNIEGELLTWNGKQYTYYVDGVRHHDICYSIDDQEKFDLLGGDVTRNNAYSGRLQVGEHGYLNTAPTDHLIDAGGYTIFDRDLSNGHNTNTEIHRYFKLNKGESSVTLETPTSWLPKHWLVVNHGAIDDQGFYYFGARMKFEGDRTGQWAGIVINSNTNQAGYYIEFRPTTLMTWDRLNPSQEVSFYSMRSDGTRMHFGGEEKKLKDGTVVHTGVPHLIAKNVWFTVDVAFAPQENGDHLISIFVDGQLAFNAVIPADSPFRNQMSGRFGMHAHGKTTATYDYLYATHEDDEPFPDNVSFLDMITGGYISDQLHREWVYRTRDPGSKTDKPNGKRRAKYDQIFLDEFGPMLHELREFNVSFDPSPVVHSNLYLTNESQVLCTEYDSDAFGATFTLANAARQNAVVEGDDDLTFPGQTVSQKALIFGRIVQQADAQSEPVFDQAAINRRGKVSIDFNSPWIQSKTQADAIGQWIVEHWSEGNGECQVVVFGNPLIELGDAVQIDYPEMSLFEGVQTYFVVHIENTFDTGLSTTLTLRKSYTAGNFGTQDEAPGGNAPVG